jgi:hypothetical protein
MRMMNQKEFDAIYRKAKPQTASGTKAVFAREVRGSDR